MALPAFVQQTTGLATGFNGSVTSTNFTSSVTNGNAILVALVTQATHNHISSITDSGGNTYSTTPIVSDIASSFYTAAYIAYNVTGGANFSVTVNDSDGNDPNFVAIEISGVVTSESVSVATGTSNSQTTPSVSTSGPTVNANDILIGIFSCEANPMTYTVGAGYSNLIQATGHTFSYNIATETQVVSATGTYSASMGGQGTSLGAAALIVALSNTAIGPTTSTSSSTSQSTSTSSTSSSTSTSISSTSSSISTSSTSSSTSISTSSTSSSTSISTSTSSTSSSTSISTSTSSTSSSTSTSNSTSLSSTSISSTSTSTTVSLTTSTSSTSSSTSRSTSTSQSTSSTSQSTSTSMSTSSTSSSTSTSKSTSTSSTSTSQSTSTSISSTSSSTSVSFTTSTSMSSTSTSTTTILYSQFKPVIDIKPQTLTQANIVPSTTLVDDPVALVDDPSTYVGSLVTPIADFRVMVSIKPKR